MKVCPNLAFRTDWAPAQQVHSIYRSDNKSFVSQSESPTVLTIENPFDNNESGCNTYELLRDGTLFSEASVQIGLII